MNPEISIISVASISPLGADQQDVWEACCDNQHRFSQMTSGSQTDWVAAISQELKDEVNTLRLSDPRYRALDDVVLYAMYASREAISRAGWNSDHSFGINIGSSRGATALFEKYHHEFLNTGRSQILASPMTTLGNISSWVAQDLQSIGPEISHSITCSTALHALLNGIAWIRAGMADRFLVGGSEASLTPFTIAQMKAMKIYSSEQDAFPCRAMDLSKRKNSMILGEGAAVCCLEKGLSNDALAHIAGIGYATEILEHSTSISAEADCFQKSMSMALADTHPDEVDAIVMHAPGTILGDRSEYNAISRIFGKDLPLLTTNKWKVGHTFGASGMLNVELALMMFEHNTFIPVPFIEPQHRSSDRPLRNILVNAVGFGGNAVSVLLRKP